MYGFPLQYSRKWYCSPFFVVSFHVVNSETVAKDSSYLRGLISENIFKWYLLLEIIQILTCCYCIRVNWDSWKLLT